MDFRNPVIVHFDAIKKRARTNKSTTCFTWVTHTVQDVTDAEAPIALQWQQTHGHQYTKVAPDLVQLRYFDGRLWQPATQTHNSHIPVDAKSVIDDPFGYNPLLKWSNYHSLNLVKQGKIPEFNVNDFRYYDAQAWEKEIRDQVERQNEFLIVEGQFWKTAKEPTYHIKDSGFYDTYQYLEITQNPASFRNTYRIDRFDDVLEAIGKSSTEEDKDYTRVDVLIPEAVQFDDERLALTETLKRIIEWKPDLEDDNRSTIESWLEARDTINALNGKFSDEDAEAAITASQLYTTLKYSDERSYRKTSFEEGIQRWQIRPIEYSLENFDDKIQQHNF